MPIGVTRDCETVVIDSYNPPVSLRLSVEEAAKLRDCIEAAIMDYDARLESRAQPPRANNNARDEISALIAEVYGIRPADRKYSREEVIMFLQRAIYRLKDTIACMRAQTAAKESGAQPPQADNSQSDAIALLRRWVQVANDLDIYKQISPLLTSETNAVLAQQHT